MFVFSLAQNLLLGLQNLQSLNGRHLSGCGEEAELVR
jgi:hypothetical protein